jgi:hypothetical protein
MEAGKNRKIRISSSRNLSVVDQLRNASASQHFAKHNKMLYDGVRILKRGRRSVYSLEAYNFQRYEAEETTNRSHATADVSSVS